VTTAISIAFLAMALLLVALAICAHGKATIARGKAEAFQEVADDFGGLARATWWRRADEQKAERKKLMLRLCLCDPKVCDALDSALVEAREFWKHSRSPQSEGQA